MSVTEMHIRLGALVEQHPWLAPKRRAGTKVIHFWNQLAIAVAVYFGYEITSEITGGSRKRAIANALKEVKFERAFHVFNEHGIQRFFIRHFLWLIKLSDLFYVTVHFILPVLVLVVLFRKFPERYLVWRNVMAVMNVIALVIFAIFPVAPPHLLPPSYHFIDTQATIGGAGSLDATLMADAGNLYAAMPSLHFAWAIWCAWALAPVVRNKWFRRALIADPFITTFVVIVTANHFWVDIVAGLLIFAISGAMFNAFSTDQSTDWALESSKH
ncbi:MAG: phosphatase PAP2 family protein [Actinomycetota bacterium]|nr:MAG: phosphatase PAP2 family protein [Actinomycetota bacterium]